MRFLWRQGPFRLDFLRTKRLVCARGGGLARPAFDRRNLRIGLPFHRLRAPLRTHLEPRQQGERVDRRLGPTEDETSWILTAFGRCVVSPRSAPGVVARRAHT